MHPAMAERMPCSCGREIYARLSGNEVTLSRVADPRRSSLMNGGRRAHCTESSLTFEFSWVVARSTAAQVVAYPLL
jgi:hypothetical protein